MSILKDIAELVKSEIISRETAEKIENYYKQKGGQSQSRLFVIFGILGAILVGLGVLLIIAHNWDELPKGWKTFFAFLPLIAGQALCFFTLTTKADSIALREGAAAFLFFAVGGSISIVAQIYNISGDLSGFLLTWMILCLPLIYLMQSSVTSLLYLVGITYYAGETSYWTYPSSESYYYWLLLLLALPHYYSLYKRNPESNFMIFHNWLFPLSITITLGTVAKSNEELLFVAYMSLFGLFYLIGNSVFFQNQKSRSNGYLTLGALGTISILLALSFDWFWEKLQKGNLFFNLVITSPEFIASSILTLLAVLVFIRQGKRKLFDVSKPMNYAYLLFIVIFFIGIYSFISIFLVNLLVLLIGVLTIRRGAKENHLGILNYGLLIMMTLSVCKFFDSDLSFVTRGLLFVTAGIGFFVANYRMLKRRKEHEY